MGWKEAVTRYSKAWKRERSPKYAAIGNRLGLSLMRQNPTPTKIPREKRVTSSTGVTLVFGATGVLESAAVDMVLIRTYLGGPCEA